MINTTVVILAAGESSRLGRPKQLIELSGRSLIRTICERALASNAMRVVVVLGGYEEQISKELKQLPVETVLNGFWKSGISSSIKKGVEAAFADSECSNVILSVVDQPYLTTEHFNQLIAKCQRGDDLVASRYANGVIGVPVLFGKVYSPALLALEGDIGAKKVLMELGSDPSYIDFPQGDFDIDNPMDLDRLLS